jgi:hypothetical protein
MKVNDKTKDAALEIAPGRRATCRSSPQMDARREAVYQDVRSAVARSAYFIAEVIR